MMEMQREENPNENLRGPKATTVDADKPLGILWL
jgi:hypothetical protein